ncbi:MULTISPECIES: UdgX family uracil-DNA binding protein [unclassified Cupriavidus]|uniref:UdgX family uracil-DNA binding protein n=1 Tax=unclassified Cupriavidus TaxID=2640874 RepID=UPI001C00511F|nr:MULTISPECIES: UdgX family uracil-DNA binding protein [unclassified Cupriavidus]MCA3187928.1 UdgX family uracil-DNA binding protein [Cupriavidus sp.]MCA3188787.1 UdgX family uracil-DNA binding protein [Cupriavidus sp.]MCA3198507.1 UdgX family uracil-DNA binding protein [Cupriavidus sp.]MCA3201253.1 UdgX family uracil-DNA binding protein [Cupriavidus sp.]MCA3208465.1 UdgX family uracil-DNA binding protein [Cupriavidus sp.]
MATKRDIPIADAAHLNACRRCDLWHDATQAVPGKGPAHAPLMLVGEQPGNDEDLRGEAFVGPAGRLLDEALARAGVLRSAVYLTNAVKHFKFETRGKRRLHKTPGQLEVEACHLWLEREIDRVRPRAIVALGATAAGSVLHRKRVTLSQMMDAPVTCDDYLVIVTYHPSFALRQRSSEARDAALDRIVASLREAARLAHLDLDVAHAG